MKLPVFEPIGTHGDEGAYLRETDTTLRIERDGDEGYGDELVWNVQVSSPNVAILAMGIPDRAMARRAALYLYRMCVLKET